MKLFFTRILICVLLLFTASLKAQKINKKKGYDTQIGIMVYMLESLKDKIISHTKGFNQIL